MRYNNYHKHSHETNARTLDCIVKPLDYINRSIELGHTSYSTCEHGWTGKFLESYDLCNEYNLKMIYAVEAYFAPDRFEKDRTNSHIMLIARNKYGFKQINSILAESNKTGFYYKNRVDMELLLKIDPDDIIITTACIAGILSEFCDISSFYKLKDHFKNSLYLETQAHEHIKQAEHNKKILEYSNLFDLPLIHANDSHYIFPDQSRYRDLFLKGKNIRYAEEEGFILDYPAAETLFKRYEKQGILKENEVKQALLNTLIFDDCETLNFNKDIKMPKFDCICPNETLKNLIEVKFKDESQNVSEGHLNDYKKAIKDETEIITKTNMSDYFLWNESIIDRAINVYNAVLTKTGRGSAISFYVNKLLGFTEIDRIDSDITLYPTRFMSISRIMDTKSLPDIDFNFADVEPVIKASKDILGDDNIYAMYALGTMKESSAFTNMCRAYDITFEKYNEISQNLDQYRNHPEWKDIIAESEHFLGVIDSISCAPSAFLLLDKPISEELGLIRSNDVLCACIDGSTADKFKYLKNDYLVVRVWFIISETFKSLNLPIPSINELKEKLDDKVWDLYARGLTSTLNQVETELTTQLVMQYKPQTVAELSAFVAAIRPGFASLLHKFINREKHSTEIPELDELLQDSYCYMLYQESIMKFLVWCGIHEDGTYDIIKKIAKKKFKEKEIQILKDKLLKGFIKNTGNSDKFNDVWQVVEDAAKYSFNASHSLAMAYDSLYCAYLKANYPLQYYTVILNEYSSDTEKTNKIVSELHHFNIIINPIQFRFSGDTYRFDLTTNSIYKGLTSIKGIGKKNNIGGQLLLFKDKQYDSFLDLLIDIKENTTIGNSIVKILIELDFFVEFGHINSLVKMFDIFNTVVDRKEFFKKDIEKYGLEKNLIEEYSTEQSLEEKYKKYKIYNTYGLMLAHILEVRCKKRTPVEILVTEHNYYNYMQSRFKVPDKFEIIQDIDIKYTPKLRTYNMKTGKQSVYKIYKDKFYYQQNYENPSLNQRLNKYDVIQINKIKKVPKSKFVDGKWIEIPNEYDQYISAFTLIEQYKGELL
jgi:DNA polymerase III alpha subunit